jgi:hypothetical protein
LLVFGGQDVLNEIGFVSQFRPFFPEDPSRPNCAGLGGGRAGPTDGWGRQWNPAEQNCYDALKHQTFAHITMSAGEKGR